jgi:DNA-binding CsgD family transcriptional regulator
VNGGHRERTSGAGGAGSNGGAVWLRERYQLTAAEVRVAALIATGHSPRDIAAQIGISFYTVRAHLRSIFDKTGVRRQNALARLLWEGP